MSRRTVVLLLAAMLWLIGAAPALAHAVLREASPADGARLADPPREVRLRFNEPVTPVSVRVLDSQGRPVSGELGGEPEGRPDGVDLPLPSGLPAGWYTVLYRVASADGHPVAGALGFTVGEAAAGSTTAPSGHLGNTAAMATAVLRACHYLTLLAGCGGCLFLLLVAPGRRRLGHRLRPGLSLLLLGTAVSGAGLVGLGGVMLTGESLAGLASPTSWSAGLGSSAGTSAALAAGAAALCAVGLAFGPERTVGAALLLAGAMTGAASLAATGHAATAAPRWLSLPLVTLHGLTAAYWVGALWPLAVALRTEPVEEAALMVRRFSALAMAAVTVLVAAGAGLSVLQIGGQIGGVSALVSSGYGLLWTGKMAVVCVLLLLAALNRIRLTPALEREGDFAVPALRRSIRCELVLVAAVLGLTALLSIVPPPRTLSHESRPAASPEAGRRVLAAGGGHMAAIRITPALPGPNRIEVDIGRLSGARVSPIQAGMDWSLTAADVTGLRGALSLSPDGRTGRGEVTLPLGGLWDVRLELLISDFDKLTLKALVLIE